MHTEAYVVPPARPGGVAGVLKDEIVVDKGGIAVPIPAMVADVELRHTTCGGYFDTSACAAVRDVRFGTGPFNSARGSALRMPDFGLFRNFLLRDRFTLQGRVEVLNVSNPPHFSSPNGNISSGGFGTITSTSPGSRTTDRRYMCLGLKAAF